MIVYPEYFDSQMTRHRRISKALAFQNPNAEDIAKIARSLGYKASVEQKHHPALWYRRRGRVVIEVEGEKKSSVIKKIAEARRG